MADYPRIAYIGGMACLVLALLSLLFFAVSPVLIGENSLVQGALPLASFALVLLAGLLVTAGTILYLYEIATAKNEGQWKAIWIIAILVFGLLGAVAYELVGRKQRMAKQSDKL